MTKNSDARRTFAILLFIAITATAWLMMHQGLRGFSHASHHDVAFNPAYQHCQRLEVATARAAMDVLGMSGPGQTTQPDQRESYQADYRLQRMQIQADSEGLVRWAAHDAQRHGLLLEVQASLAALRTGLDQATGTTAPSTQADMPTHVPLLAAVSRVQSALSNYAASLTQPANLQRTQYLFAGPVLLWWLLVFLLFEIAALAWLVFSSQSDRADP